MSKDFTMQDGVPRVTSGDLLVKLPPEYAPVLLPYLDKHKNEETGATCLYETTNEGLLEVPFGALKWLDSLGVLEYKPELTTFPVDKVVEAANLAFESMVSETFSIRDFQVKTVVKSILLKRGIILVATMVS